MRLMRWQRDLLALLRTPGDVAVSMGRGNGKTRMLAMVAARVAGISGPPGSDVVIVASALGQARIAFTDAVRDLRTQYGDALDDRKVWRVNNTPYRCEALHVPTDRRLMAIGSDPRRAHGLRPVLVLADEPAQWLPGQAEEMVAALQTGLGKFAGSRLAWIGTRAADPEHFYSRELEALGDRALVYAAEDHVPWDSWAAVRAANPSIHYKAFAPLREKIKTDRERARGDPALKASYMALRLNMGVADTVERLLFDPDRWREAEARTALPAGRPVVGIDLASTGMAAAAAVYESGAADAFGAFPSEPGLRERGRRDNVGSLYVRMHGRGELIEAGGHTVDVAAVLAEVWRRWGPPVAIVADRWREAELREALGRRAVRLVLRGMGYRDGGEDVRRAQRATGEWLAPPESLLLRSAVASARLSAPDPAGNVKLGRAATRRRDDAAVALVLATAEAARRKARPKRTLRWAVV